MLWLSIHFAQGTEWRYSLVLRVWLLPIIPDTYHQTMTIEVCEGQMGAGENLKNVGMVALGIIVLIAVISIPIALLYGAAAASVWAMEFLPTVFGWSLTVVALVLTPLALIPVSRGFSGNGFVFVSYAFGLILWLFSMAYIYLEWGLFPLFVGILMGGFGVVPIAFILSIFDAAWGVLGNIVMLGILTLVARILGFWLIEKAADREIAIAAARAEADMIVPATRID